MTTRKQRLHVYLPPDLSKSLDVLADDPHTSKSAIVADALRLFFEARAGHALDGRFGVRIDRLGRSQERVEERVAYIAEALGTFVQHHLTQTAHHPAFTPDTIHLGQQRFRAFVDAVGRRLARRTNNDPLTNEATEISDDQP